MTAGSIEAADSLGRASWLAGCWELAAGERMTHETWMKPLGGTMLGMSRTVIKGRTVEFEYLRMEERNGDLFYVALPSGQLETAFKLVEQTDSLLRFSNPTHDFPQSIRYRRLSDGSLLAQIEGEREGKTRVIDFPMQRVRCDEVLGRASD
jgi:hypothetical protein